MCRTRTIIKLPKCLTALCLGAVWLVFAAGFAAAQSASAGASSNPLTWRLFGGERAVAAGLAFSIKSELAGNDGAMPPALAEALTAASALISGRRDVIETAADLLNTAKGDYRRLLAVFYDHGFYGADISITVNGVEAASQSLGAELRAPIRVVIAARSGPQFRFGAVSIGPVPDDAPLPGKSRQRAEQMRPVPGEIAAAGLVKTATAAAVEAWRQSGHPLAKPVDVRIIADHRKQALDVLVRLDPGPQLAFTKAEIAGASTVDAEFLAYIADLPVTHLFDPDTLAEARARLVRLGMFSAVVVEEGKAPENGVLPVRFVVTEKKPRRIGASLAVSSSDGVSATGFWRHRNLFGRAERLTVEASVEGIGNRPTFAALDYALGIEFRKPGALAPDTDLVASTGIERSVVSTVENAVLDIELGFARTRGTAIDTVSGFAAISQTTDTSGTRNFRLIGAKYGLTRDSRDNLLDPTQGRYVDLDLTGFHEFGFGNTGLRLAVDGRAYFSAGQSGQTVFALRGYFGSLIGVPIGASPGEYLFFSGGGGSVRGYQYRSRGVTIGGVFSGGLSVANVSAEMRMKVSDQIGLVGFVDAGLVGQNAFPTAAGNLHVGLGVGLRYRTSFGPIRFDIARGLNRVAGDPDFAIYVGLGQAF